MMLAMHDMFTRAQAGRGARRILTNQQRRALKMLAAKGGTYRVASAPSHVRARPLNFYGVSVYYLCEIGVITTDGHGIALTDYGWAEARA